MDLDHNVSNDADQADGQDLLRTFCENGFDGDEGRAGLVLGRPASEIRDMIAGEAEVDEDLVMKARGIAKERGIKLD